jgi:ferric-dicitrate binding protein FerR (iron transport regulator)
MKILSLRNNNRSPVSLELNLYGRRAAAFLIAVTLLSLSLPLFPVAPVASVAVAATGRDALGATGVIRVAGTVTIDGVQGTSGQTIFTGSHIATAAGSESIVDLGRATRFRLSPETDFTLDFSRACVSSKLGGGIVRGFVAAGLPVNIRTAGGELVTDPSQAAEFIVEVTGADTRVSVKTGRVELRTDGKLKTVSAGEAFTTADPQDQPDNDDEGLGKKEKIGIIAAIGGVATILIVILQGREKQDPEPEFGGCAIILSGTSSGICP